MALFQKKEKTKEDYYLASQWTLMGRKLKKHKLAKISMIILLCIYHYKRVIVITYQILWQIIGKMKMVF